MFSYVIIKKKKITQPSTLSFLLANILDSLYILKVFSTAIVFLVLVVGPRTLRRLLFCPTTAMLYLPQRSIYSRGIYHCDQSTHAVFTTVLYLPLCCIYHCAILITFILSVLRHRLNKLTHKS